MKENLLIVLYIILFSVSISTFGQQINTPTLIYQEGHFNVKDYAKELNGVTEVNHLYQDKEGIIWIGTLHGLFFYDGYEIKPITDIFPTATMSYVTSIIEDENGNIWYGQEKLYLYNKKENSLKDFNLTNYETNTTIEKIVLLDKNTLWLCTNKSEILAFDIPKKTSQKVNFPIKTTINKVVSLDSKTFGLATDTGFWLYDSEKEVFFLDNQIPNTTNSLEVRDIIKDKNEIWLATNQGLFNYKNNNWTIYSFNQQININTTTKKDVDNIYHIVKDKKGVIWIASYYEGISLFYPTTNEFASYIPTNSAHNDLVVKQYNDLFLDQLGHIWLVNSTVGFYRIDANNLSLRRIYRELGQEKTLAAEMIWDVAEDSRGNIWVGTAHYETSGLSKYTNKWNFLTNYRYNKDDKKSLSHNAVYAILEDKQKKLWLGTENGLNLFNYETNNFDYFKPPNSSKAALKIWNIYQTRDDKIWLASYGGLQEFDYKTKNFKIYQHDSTSTSLQSNRVWLIYEDLKNDMWIGMYPNGLDRFDRDTETFEHMIFFGSDGQKMEGIIPISIFEDQNQKLWLITMGEGIFSYNRAKNKWIPFSKDIPDKNCMTAVKDAKNRIWISSTKEVFLFIPEEEKITRFSDKKMFLDAGASSISGTVCKDGRIIFGSDGGLVAFDPDSVVKINVQQNTKIKLRLLQINGGLDTTKLVLEGGIYQPKKLILEAGNNSFNVEFTAIHHQDINDIDLSYKLEGYNKEWIKLNPNNKRMSFTNIPPDEYRLIIKAKNSITNQEDILYLPVSVIPEFYQTWWFYFTIVFLIVLVFLLLCYIILITRKANTQLEYFLVTEKEQKEQISKANTQLESFLVLEKEQKEQISILRNNLKHQVVNDLPLLTKIASFSLKKLKKKEGQETFLKYQAQISALNKTYNVLLRDGTKAELDDAFLLQLCESTCDSYDGQDIEVETQTNISYQILNTIDIIQDLIIELVRNAVKYAFEFRIKERKIIISFQKDKNDFIWLDYQDTGVGITEGFKDDSQGMSFFKECAVENTFVCQNRSEGGMHIKICIKKSFLNNPEV